MQLVIAGGLLLVAVTSCIFASSDSDCNGPEKERLCRIEGAIVVLENAVQELLDRTDITMAETEVPQKRKNEFIRFGKRSINNEKRKNEFIRFGKRKNEFIRFG
ncbi:hypothetical protein WR25_14892 [Diploscapter pachys]|uniref:Uncharacterized protein n=1 Tax=Diploscapter pachys TaxID=2018661 RepID=A0A2A2LV65_9BILA|nr:hypothetical protein WR25_14892 [Diploscapter pachys]